MSTEKINYGKFVTKNIVRDVVTPKLYYDPEIEAEMASYTIGKFETHNIVRPAITPKLYTTRPCLKLTLTMVQPMTLTYAEVMQRCAGYIAAIIRARPQLELSYSEEHSKVEDGKLVVTLIPQTNDDNVETMLDDYLAVLHDVVSREGCLNEPQPAKFNEATYEIDYVTI